MAILKGLEGQAHVETKDSLSDWNGYIILSPDLASVSYFDIVGPKAEGVYEGPAMIDGQYYLVNGDVLVRGVHYQPSRLRVEFVGNGPINIIRLFSDAPEDYLP